MLGVFYFYKILIIYVIIFNTLANINRRFIYMSHRGRFQAQGQRLEESEPWKQSTGLILKDSLNLINKLENKLSKKDKKIRKKAFSQTRKFAENANKNGGISVVGLKNFSKTFLVSGKERVDIEIHQGKAFL